jgi:thiamine-phosphate pyrophosphorylase
VDRETPRKPLVCYVTDRKSLGSAEPGEILLAKIRAAVSASVDWVQVREKDLPARELLGVVRAAISIAQDKTRVIVNDRLDVAVAAGAAGVHLGAESMPVREVVPWCRDGNAPAGFLIGVSCHSVDQAREAESAGASYIFFGPIFDTPSKRPFGPPQGVGKLREVCRAVRLPVLAIGGANEENGAECIRAGAAGIAAIRMFQGASDAEEISKRIARFQSATQRG